jgi:hypothetical protein
MPGGRYISCPLMINDYDFNACNGIILEMVYKHEVHES